MGLVTQLYAIVAGVETDISDAVRYIHIGNDNFGMVPLERLNEKGPLQHGDTDIGFRLQPRTIQLVLNLLADDTGNDSTDYWLAREEILNLFKPRNDPIKLKFVYPLGTRQIDCHYVGGMTFSSQDRQANIGQRLGITLKANDPRFYDPTSVSVPFGLSYSASAFSIPLSIPLGIGASTLDQSVSVTYDGSFLEYPIIVIYGPVTNLVISNDTTDEILDFTGSTIANGDVYTIDTRYGYKTVKDASNVNQISKLTTGSDLSTFHLESDPDAPGGINTISVTGTSVSAVTAIYLQYNARYIGV